MTKTDHDKRLIRLKSLDALNLWIPAFLRDSQARKLSPATVRFYRDELAGFVLYAGSQNITEVTAITADLVRGYLTFLETDHKRNHGGCHAAFRAVRVFVYWWQRETEPDNWQNPFKNIKMGKPKLPPIPGVPVPDVGAMVATCQGDFIGTRDKAMLLCLLDCGARAAEFIALNLDDIDFISGGVTIRKGKGSKSRTVFIGKKARKALRAYLKKRGDKDPALWVTDEGARLAVSSLRQVLERRARRAGIPLASPHDFRRAFAVNMLRAGVDLVTLARLMGHESIEVLARYLALVTDDLRQAHAQGSPVDRLL